MSRIVKVKNNVIKTVTHVARVSNVASLTVDQAHGFAPGNLVTVDVDDDSYDVVNVAIIATPTSTTFTYANTGTDELTKVATGTAGIQKVFNGQSIDPGQYYDITLELESWGTNESIQLAVSDRSLVVSKGDEDGSDDISNVITAWGYITGSILEISNLPLSQIDGNIRTEIHKPEGISASLVTPNMADPCTWYYQSVQEVDDVLTDTGDGLTWISSHHNWIDLYTGRLVKEHELVASYPITVKVDSVVQSMGEVSYATASYGGVTFTAKKKGLDGNNISLTFNGTDTVFAVTDAWNLANPYNPVLHDGTGSEVLSAGSVDLVAGDYTFDPVVGSVTFYTSKAGSTVEATYNYENGAEWRMIPQPGQYIEIVRSELQFAKNTVLHTAFRFEVWVYHPDQINFPGVKFKFDQEVYNNMKDFISTGNLGTGEIPIVDGLSSETCVFPFDYVTKRTFQSSIGAELRLTKDDNIPVSGNFATATFYVVIGDL